ncbi:hypothetical protein NL676_018190 [Syzygium grande]|nr:hypothetical protein NL676_018190 [Syzygium grande]
MASGRDLAGTAITSASARQRWRRERNRGRKQQQRRQGCGKASGGKLDRIKAATSSRRQSGVERRLRTMAEDGGAGTMAGGEQAASGKGEPVLMEQQQWWRWADGEGGPRISIGGRATKRRGGRRNSWVEGGQ